VNRRAPFEKKSERGFRDAIIVETFMQLVNDSPHEPRRCRIVLMTNDGLLGDAARTRVSDRDNVQVLPSADELRGLINTLMSTVPEEYVVQLQKKASKYFLDSDQEQRGLYYELNLTSKIQDECAKELAAKPPGADRRQSGQWFLTPPRFVKKERQRVYWASRVSIEAKAYKRTLPQPAANVITSESTGFSLNPDNPWITAHDAMSPTWQASPMVVAPSSISPPRPRSSRAIPSWVTPAQVNFSTFGDLIGAGTERLIAAGKTVIDVNWSFSVSVRGTFAKPRLESIDFVETVWENKE